jgi:hypothetical protein
VQRDTGQDPAVAKKVGKITKAIAAANTFDAIVQELCTSLIFVWLLDRNYFWRVETLRRLAASFRSRCKFVF